MILEPETQTSSSMPGFTSRSTCQIQFLILPLFSQGPHFYLTLHHDFWNEHVQKSFVVNVCPFLIGINTHKEQLYHIPYFSSKEERNLWSNTSPEKYFDLVEVSFLLLFFEFAKIPEEKLETDTFVFSTITRFRLLTLSCNEMFQNITIMTYTKIFVLIYQDSQAAYCSISSTTYDYNNENYSSKLIHYQLFSTEV